jgi:cytochrome c oxidase assembly protein subunit 11
VSTAEALRSENRITLRKLMVVALIMFGFGFALVPIYKKLCEAAGINNLFEADELRNTQVDATRTVTIQFDTNTRDLPWQFKPLQKSITAHPGELVQVQFEVHNDTSAQVFGQAVPSYGPQLAGQFVKKSQCFCFTRQALQPSETRQMPVVFVVDPQLPRDVNVITISYTFFQVPGGQG